MPLAGLLFLALGGTSASILNLSLPDLEKRLAEHVFVEAEKKIEERLVLENAQGARYSYLESDAAPTTPPNIREQPVVTEKVFDGILSDAIAKFEWLRALVPTNLSGDSHLDVSFEYTIGVAAGQFRTRNGDLLRYTGVKFIKDERAIAAVVAIDSAGGRSTSRYVASHDSRADFGPHQLPLGFQPRQFDTPPGAK